MAFTVENNEGLIDANAYITVEFLQSYAASIGSDIAAQTDEQLQQCITDVTYNFIDTKYAPVSEPLNSEQALQWPTKTQLINGKFKRAVAEACVLNFTDSLFITQDANGKVKSTRSKLDVLEKEIEYQDGSSMQSSYMKTPQIDKLMSEFTCGGLGGISVERWA